MLLTRNLPACLALLARPLPLPRTVTHTDAWLPHLQAFHVSCQLPNSSSSARNLSNDSVPSSSGSSAFPQSPLAALTQRLPFFPRQQPRLVQAEANTGGTDGGSSSGGSGGGGGDGGGDGKGDEGKDDDDKILTLKDVSSTHHGHTMDALCAHWTLSADSMVLGYSLNRKLYSGRSFPTASCPLCLVASTLGTGCWEPACG